MAISYTIFFQAHNITLPISPAITPQRQHFSNMTDFEVDGTTLNLYFNEDDVLSMASTESNQFWEVLHEPGFRYGISEVNLFNQDGERGLVFAESIWKNRLQLSQNRIAVIMLLFSFVTAFT